MASSKISELTDGTQFEPGDETIIVRNGVNWKVDPTKNAVQAWVNFNGTGTVAINASYNVSSITDNGTGDYSVNFTNALTDADYTTIGSHSSISSNSSSFTTDGTYNTTVVQIGTSQSGGRVDPTTVSVAIIR